MLNIRKNVKTKSNGIQIVSFKEIIKKDQGKKKLKITRKGDIGEKARKFPCPLRKSNLKKNLQY